MPELDGAVDAGAVDDQKFVLDRQCNCLWLATAVATQPAKDCPQVAGPGTGNRNHELCSLLVE
jgi:hypothetical protein